MHLQYVYDAKQQGSIKFVKCNCGKCGLCMCPAPCIVTRTYVWISLLLQLLKDIVWNDFDSAVWLG